MNFDEMAEKLLAAFPFDNLAGADASESELRAAARAAIDEAVANVHADGWYSYGRRRGFEACAKRGRRPDCGFRGGNAWNEDLLTLDLSYDGEPLARAHIGSTTPREKDL
jgi:hypothetical protein